MPQKRTREPAQVGRFGPDVRVAMILGRRTYRLVERNEDDWLLGFHPSMNGLDLTGMTVEELDALKEFFNDAIETVRPICERLDAEAREAAANGDVTLFRLYSNKPKTMRFPRPDKKEKQDDNPDPHDG